MSSFPLLLAGGYAVAHGVLVASSSRTLREKAPILLADLLILGLFLAPVALGLPSEDVRGFPRALLLWGPVVFFWWAYLWSRHTLHALHPPGRSVDTRLIRLEHRIGQPSLNWARDRSRLVTEFFVFLYFTYYLYTPLLGLVLDLQGRVREFQAMTSAVCLGYLVSYVTFSLVPAYGPRWSLVTAGLLDRQEQHLRGYQLTRLINRIMFGGPALKGGAMPSSHSSTAVVFAVWAWRLWGAEGGVPATLIALGMEMSAIYGRFHYLTDVIVGSVLGVIAILVADAVVGPF